MAFHREQDNVNQECLLIANREDVPKEGLLVVKLGSEKAVDAIRQKAHSLAYGLQALSLMSVMWEDDILANVSRPLNPRAAFAILSAPCMNKGDMSKVCEIVDGGLGGRHADAGTVLSQWEALETEGRDEMMNHFEEWRIEMDWDERYFLLCTGAAWSAGKVDLVSARPGKQWQWPCETAGEVLAWLYIEMIGETDIDDPPSMVKALLPVP